MVSKDLVVYARCRLLTTVLLLVSPKHIPILNNSQNDDNIGLAFLFTDKKSEHYAARVKAF